MEMTAEVKSAIALSRRQILNPEQIMSSKQISTIECCFSPVFTYYSKTIILHLSLYQRSRSAHQSQVRHTYLMTGQTHPCGCCIDQVGQILSCGVVVDLYVAAAEEGRRPIQENAAGPAKGPASNSRRERSSKEAELVRPVLYLDDKLIPRPLKLAHVLNHPHTV